MNKIEINYPKVAEAEQQLNVLANSISEDFMVDVTKSQGDFADELRVAVNDMNELRKVLVEVIEKTAEALNNTVKAFKQADESISYKG